MNTARRSRKPARSAILGEPQMNANERSCDPRFHRVAKSHFRLVGLRCRAASHDRQVVRHQSEMTSGNQSNFFLQAT